MKKQYQVTLICITGQYRPISCIITREQETEENLLNNPTERKAIIADGVRKICAKRYWDNTYLKQYHYSKVKVREYDKEKIEEENKLRYEQIKEQKYATGEWKKPKSEAQAFSIEKYKNL